MRHFFATASFVALTTGALGLWLGSIDAIASATVATWLSSPVSLTGDQAVTGDMATVLTQIPSPQTLISAGLVVDVCLNLPDWQRPSDYTQVKQLQAMGRYESATEITLLSEDTKAWWGHEAFSFTTYGLSARTDPLYLSGVWTAMDHIWDCYSDDQPERINAGDLAELWLLNHRLVSLEWQEEAYLVTVEPSNAGLQLVQFPRQDNRAQLPVQIITTDGMTLPTLDGDW
jgi:hypothetical protein